MRKLGFLSCVLCLIVFSGDLDAKERHGADAVIAKKDGQAVKGELIAVKEHSILLLASSTKSDLSIDISEIRSIKIAKKPKAGAGTIIGFLLGGGAGALIGYEVGWETSKGAVIGGAIGVLGGVGAGLLFDTQIKKWETFHIEGESPEATKLVLDKLRTRARVPNFR